MFLGVHGRLGAVKMTELDSVALGERIEGERRRQYGTKKAAYTAADVNPATWDKAEAGEAHTLRDDRLARIVRTLWPESDGDWRRVMSVGGGVDDRREQEDTLLFQRPEGLTDDQWAALLRRARPVLEALADDAAQER